MQKFARLSQSGFALLCLAPAVWAAQVTIVLRPGGTGWEVRQAEKITFNQKEKLRIGSSKALELRPDAYKALQQLEILKAGLLRMHSGGYLVRRTEGGWEPVTADGLQVKTATSFAMLWSSAPVAILAERNAKTPTTLRPAEIYAIIPGADANEAVAALIADPANFRGLGEANEDAAFDERMSLLVGVAPTITGPGKAKLQGILLEGMRTAEQHISSGVAKKGDLDLGLKFVEVSAKAYPGDDQQKKARDVLIARKNWLDRRMAILSALNAGELWDDFLNKYSDFDRWDNSFEALRKARQEAFQKSGDQHRAAGDAYYKDKNYALALREFNLAHARLPSNKEIDGKIEQVTLDDERQTALRSVKVVEDKTSSSYRVVTRHLQDADLYIKDGKLTEAGSEIDQARGADPTSPRILLSTAKLQRARNKLPDALRTLQDYFRQVPTDEEADTLRNNIRHELNTALEQKEKAIADAEAVGDYAKAWQAANDGLELDDGNLNFLLHSGLDGAMLRKSDAAGKLDKYLSLSQTPGADQKQRADVYKFQPLVAKPTLPKSEGTPNWFSGYNNPPGLMYCPISLMPNVRIADIKSRKQISAFQWAGNHLVNIHTTSQDPLDKELNVFFEYSKDAVRRVGLGALDSKDDPNSLRFTPQGAKGNGNGVYSGLPNNPLVDPIMVERLTGHPVATLVSGNPYFHPFAWVGIYTFLAEYDDQGRVTSARLISNDPTPFTLDFKWDGLKLMEITQRGGDYKRTMIYTANRLTQERITFRSKTSTIDYEYKNGQLVGADAKEDASIDNRPRQVTFRQ